MKWFLLFNVLIQMAYGQNGQKIYDLYQQGMYREACDLGYRFFAPNQNNEPYVSLVGFSCLKADQIDRLSPVMSALSETKESRANSAYFALIVMQKKLLMQALYDNKSLQYLQFPTSPHLISKLFHLYLKNPQLASSIKDYTDPVNTRQSYKLYTVELNGKKTIAIDEYYDKILTIHHTY